jgi:hypothetical protein
MGEKIKLGDEKGSVMVLAVILLVLLTLLGMAALSTSSIETQVAGNEMRNKLALYAAESGAAYVAERPDLYGPENITPGTPQSFPNPSDPYTPIIGILPPADQIDGNQSQTFNGKVEYQSAASPPRGSGYAVGKFKSHRYQMTCNGYSTHSTKQSIVIGFYRIGF